jgi:hypothetical protein
MHMPRDLVKAADESLYAANGAGRDTVSRVSIHRAASPLRRVFVWSDNQKRNATRKSPLTRAEVV